MSVQMDAHKLKPSKDPGKLIVLKGNLKEDVKIQVVVEGAINGEMAMKSKCVKNVQRINKFNVEKMIKKN